MEPRHAILATAGHIDHGKSALVKALTGSEPDRLPEEKLRGITIDLGFAHLELLGHSLGVVDVAGHLDFVKFFVYPLGTYDLKHYSPYLFLFFLLFLFENHKIYLFLNLLK